MRPSIKETIKAMRNAATSQSAGHAVHLSNLHSIGIAAFLAFSILLSIWSNYLFFKELTSACSIIFISLLLNALSHPTGPSEE